MSDIAALEELVEGLIDDHQRPRVELDRGGGEFHLRTLLKMARWAVEQQPHQPGDQVCVKPNKVASIPQRSGWFPFRQQLLDGPHEVVAVEFNGAHEYWATCLRVDGRKFSIPTSWIEAT